MKNNVAQIWLYYISTDCKFHVLSEKYKTHMLKINRKLLPGKIALIYTSASTTALTQIIASESSFFAFAAYGAVLCTPTLNKFLT